MDVEKGTCAIPGLDISESKDKLDDLEIADEDSVLIEIQNQNEGWSFIEAQRCSQCKKKPINYECSKCKKKRWCGFLCFMEDSAHKQQCTQKNANTHSTRSQGGRGGVGLQNLGNTCFMNSGLQCLLHTVPLSEYFLAGAHQQELNKSNPLGTGGALAKEFSALVQVSSSCGSSYHSPWSFKQTLSKFASQFTGYAQHDSQELITFVLDGLHEDLNRIRNKPYTEQIESDGRPDSIVASLAWENHLKRNNSIIVDLMHGQLKSTLVCPKCERVSTTFDPYSVLSIDIPSKEVRKFDITVVPQQLAAPVKKCQVNLPLHNKVTDLKQKIFEKLDIEQDSGYILGTSDMYNRFINKEDDYSVLENISNKNLLMYELPESSEASYKFSMEFKKSSNYSSYSSYSTNVGYARIVDLPLNTTCKQLYHYIYEGLSRIVLNEGENQNATLESVFTDLMAGAKEVKNDPFEVQIQAVHERNPIVAALNPELQQGNKQRTSNGMGTNIYYSQNLECKFCGRRNCSGCRLMYTEEETIESLVKKSNFKIIIQFSNKLKNKLSILEKESKADFHTGPGSPMNVEKGVSLKECFEFFSRGGTLTPDNAWYCNKCKDHVCASKKLELYSVPQILIIHLKRFKSRGYNFRQKNDKLVNYPIEGLDLSDFIQSEQSIPPIYDLYAVSIHSGGLGGGHYIAYAKTNQSWYCFNDSSVSGMGGSPVTQGAYVLFYKRRNS